MLHNAQDVLHIRHIYEYICICIYIIQIVFLFHVQSKNVLLFWSAKEISQVLMTIPKTEPVPTVVAGMSLCLGIAKSTNSPTVQIAAAAAALLCTSSLSS